jgi:hypothetical protein
MKKSLVILVAFAAAFGGWQAWKARVPLPRITLQDAQSKSVTLDDMLDGKSRAVFLFLLPGCGLSRSAMQTAKEAYPEYGDRVAFVGLLMTGNAGSAEAFQKDNELPFPVYALGTASDPFAVKELMDRVGTWRGVYGGTTVLVDTKRRPLFTGRLEDTRKLPEVLRKQRI